MRPPRYEQIARTLRRRITSGKVSVGEALPTEAQLCETYGVSRYTAREALRRLRDAGLITRRRRAGSTVAAAAARSTFILPVSSATDLFRYATDTQFLIERCDRIRAGATEVALLGCGRGQEWFRLSGIRVQPGAKAPVCLTTVYLHASLGGLAKRMPRSAGVIYPQVEEALGSRIARSPSGSRPWPWTRSPPGDWARAPEPAGYGCAGGTTMRTTACWRSPTRCIPAAVSPTRCD